MKVYVQRDVLSKALDIADAAISSRSTMPILSNFLLEAIDDILIVSATNRERTIRVWIEANVTDKGLIALPARLLKDYVASLPSETVLIDVTLRTMSATVSTAQSTATIKGLDPADYPILDTPPTCRRVDVDQKVLVDLIQGVSYSASDDESKPTLTGAKIVIEDGFIKMVTTDGYRLSSRKAECSKAEHLDAIIRAADLEAVAKMAKTSDGEILTMLVNGNKDVTFCLSGKGDIVKQTIRTEIIDARYPDYMAIVPKTFNTSVILEVKVLKHALKVATLFARDNANIIHMKVVPEDNRVLISATSTEMGDTVSEMDAEISGGGISIAFNVRYLLQLLDHLTEDRIVLELTHPTRPGRIYPLVLELTHPTRPGRIYPQNEDRENYLYVIMPMHPQR